MLNDSPRGSLPFVFLTPNFQSIHSSRPAVSFFPTFHSPSFANGHLQQRMFVARVVNYTVSASSSLFLAFSHELSPPSAFFCWKLVFSSETSWKSTRDEVCLSPIAVLSLPETTDSTLSPQSPFSNLIVTRATLLLKNITDTSMDVSSSSTRSLIIPSGHSSSPRNVRQLPHSLISPFEFFSPPNRVRNILSIPYLVDVRRWSSVDGRRR